MSLFKKPNRKVRQRLAHADSDEEDHTSLLRTKEERKNKDKDDRIRTTQTLLSFGASEEDAEEGTFKVKKSSYSRRIAKELEKERRRKRNPDDDSLDDDGTDAEKKSLFKGDSAREFEIPDADGIEIRIKNSIRITKEKPVNNGDSKKLDGDNLDSHENGDEDLSDSKILFNRERVSKALEKGAIPDAATIFALKKKRQQMAGKAEQDFLPLNSESKNANGRSAESRLARDDDDDSEPEEGRLNFSDIRSGRRDEMREVLGDRAYPNGPYEDVDDEEENETLRWEKEQIRKGVGTLTGAQDLKDFDRSPSPNAEDRFRISKLPPVHIPKDKSNLSIASIVDRVRNRISTVEEIVARSTNQHSMTTIELGVCAETIEKLEKAMPRLEKEFKFYQEVRTYSVDLIECLDSKLPIITALEGRFLSTLAQRAEKLSTRRRQDIKDQSEEVRTTTIVDTALRTRAREREGRRVRRKTVRQTGGNSKHFEGMSSDDEEIETERLQMSADLEQIRNDVSHIFEDVNDEFNKLSGIVTQFEKWKIHFNDSYQEAYVPICVLKLVVPFVRLEMIDWNPLEEPDCMEKSEWYRELLFFGYTVEEKDESDLTLIPKVVERAVLPKILQYVERVWDPMSTSQTRNLVRCLHKITEEFTLGRKSKPLANILGKVYAKLQSSLEEDIFIPMASKEINENPLCPASLFFHRQFWSAMKLLSNIFSWHGILAEKAFRELALTGLLNRYLLFSLQCSIAHKDTVERVEAIGAMLPTSWLRGDLPVELQMFAKFLEGLTKQLRSSYAPDSKIQTVSKLYEALTKSVKKS